MIRVMLVEDHKILREGLKTMFNNDPDISIVAEAEDGKDAIEQLSHENIDVMILDINLPGIMSGTQVASHVSLNFSNVRILVLSMMDNENYVYAMFKVGAIGYLPKSTGKDELMMAIKKVAEGESYVSYKISMKLFQRSENIAFVNLDGKKISLDFSKRERAVLSLIAEGYTNEEIAEKTFTSKRTVESHRKNMIDKTGVRNTAALIRFAINNGIIK